MDALQQLTETVTKINTAWEEFKKENNTQVGKAVKDALAEAKISNLQQAIDDLTGTRADLEKRIALEKAHREELERKVNLLTVQPGDKATDKEIKFLSEFNRQRIGVAAGKGLVPPSAIELDPYRMYCKAHDKWVRKGEHALSGEELKSLQVGVDPDGGYLTPADYSGRMVTALFDLSPIRQIAAVQEISSDRLDGIDDPNEASFGWVSEVAARTATNTPQVGKWEIVAQEMYAAPQATQRVLDDAAIDVEAWLAAKIADKFARAEGKAFVVGTGVGQPRGFTTYTTVQTNDDSRTWGQLESVKSGASAAFAADPNGGDVLFDLIAAFRPPYLANARWVTRRDVIAKIRKMKATTGNYLWQPGLIAGQPDLLAGYPITIAQDMPALASASLSLALGDFKQAYQIVDRLGVRTLRDPFTNKPYVIFYTTKRTGGAVINYQAVKFITFTT